MKRKGLILCFNGLYSKIFKLMCEIYYGFKMALQRYLYRSMQLYNHLEYIFQMNQLNVHTIEFIFLFKWKIVFCRFISVCYLSLKMLCMCLWPELFISYLILILTQWLLLWLVFYVRSLFCCCYCCCVLSFFCLNHIIFLWNVAIPFARLNH